MDFNFGNLMSSAIGAVVKVATAVVDFFSPTAEAGGILGGLAGIAVGLAEAVLGASSAVAEAREDGELSDEQAEELFEEKFKALLGAYMLSIRAGSSNSESDEEEEYLDFPVQVTDGAAVTYDKNGGPSEQKSVWDCVLGVKDYFGDSVKDFTIGAGYSVDNNMFFGIPTHIAGMNDDNLPDSTSCKVGRIAGDVASIIGSGTEIVVGAGGEIGGIALDATGGGAVVGVPINVASAALVSDGVVNGYRSTTSLADDLMNFAKRDQEGGRPKKGKEFRGGSKKQRDNWYGYNNRDFQKWWERKGKKEWGGDDIQDSKMAKEVYEDWVSKGNPIAD